MSEREIARVVTTSAPSPGFIGDGHTAVKVVDSKEFPHNDPFIVLMDDRIDLEPGREAGGAHPHGGFETVTFVVEGELRDRDEGTLGTGDVLWMTAGSGVIHNENVVPLGKTIASTSVIGGDEGARVILYAGERQGVPIVMHGPFVGESRADIMRLSRAYTEGKLPRISELAHHSNRRPVMASGEENQMAEAMSGDRH